jgi:hypothetical protein
MISNKIQVPLFVFGLAGFILFPSCKKSNNNSNPSTASITFMDSAIQFSSISATVSGTSAVITATDNMKFFGLSLLLWRPFVLNKTLDMDSVGDEIMVTLTGRPDQWFIGSGGEPADGKLTITSWDSAGHRLAGTFSGVLSAGPGYSDTLSAGKFDVEYIVN